MEQLKVKRVFKFNGKELPDPDSKMAPRMVMKQFVAQHPVLANASVTGPVFKEDKAIYTFETNFGSKG